MPRTETNPALRWGRVETGRENPPAQGRAPGQRAPGQRPRHAARTLRLLHAKVPDSPAAPAVPTAFARFLSVSPSSTSHNVSNFFIVVIFTMALSDQ